MVEVTTTINAIVSLSKFFGSLKDGAAKADGAHRAAVADYLLQVAAPLSEISAALKRDFMSDIVQPCAELEMYGQRGAEVMGGMLAEGEIARFAQLVDAALNVLKSPERRRLLAEDKRGMLKTALDEAAGNLKGLSTILRHRRAPQPAAPDLGALAGTIGKGVLGRMGALGQRPLPAPGTLSAPPPAAGWWPRARKVLIWIGWFYLVLIAIGIVLGLFQLMTGARF